MQLEFVEGLAPKSTEVKDQFFLTKVWKKPKNLSLRNMNTNVCPHSLKMFPGSTSNGSKCINAEVGIRLFSSNNSVSEGFLFPPPPLMNSVRKNHHSFYKDHLQKEKAEESPITNYSRILRRNTINCNSMQKRCLFLITAALF